MLKKEQFITRKIAGEYVMMPIEDTALKFNGLILANDVSSFIWDHIEEVTNAHQLTQLICKNFEVDFNEAYHDTKYILDEMIKAGWIE